MCPPDVAFRGRARLQHSRNCSGEGVVKKFREIWYLSIASAHLIRVDTEIALTSWLPYVRLDDIGLAYGLEGHVIVRRYVFTIL